ncbi:hypothetical protein [Halovivax limisalsi]|uniref:hypothetical protein n=1 Tax=Halovivax limisalsi TaxID=1453760 RepID=UPI001FFD8555|nr:hypothetical protein [Halovivax limisalsi]
MVSDDAKDMYEAIYDRTIKSPTTWVDRDVLYDHLDREGWSELRIEETESELFQEMMIEESLDSESLRPTGNTPEGFEG